MSFYISDSLVGKINIENDILTLNINDKSFKILKMALNKNMLSIKFKAGSDISNLLLNKSVPTHDIFINWQQNKIITDYVVLSLTHILELETDNYILKINLSLEEK